MPDLKAREYYEREALLGGWSVRQLDRQIASLAYRRTRGARSRPVKDEILPADAHVRDPLVLEFLNLKDEYSETELENGLMRSIEQFLLELGNDFAFVARQKRLRVGTEWYRVDLVFFHRRLQCLIIVDLKLGKFTHADAGQMNLYVNYAREHWTHPHENPPVAACGRSGGESEFAGGTACATTANQQFGALVGQAFSLPGLLPRAVSLA